MRFANPVEYLTNPRARVYYATQFGYYWSLTKDQLRAVLQAGATGEGFNLSELGASRPIKHKPKVFSTVFAMLDWEQEAFETTLRELDAGETHFLHQTWIWGA